MTALAVVTGACGFIGRHVCRSLAAQGVSVRGLGHGAWTPTEAANWGMSRWLAASVSFNSLSEVFGSDVPDAVIHCAGSGSVSHSYAEPYDDYQRSVATVATLLEHVRAACNNRPRVVLASSAAVYGDQGDVDFAETDICSPISPYGFHKRAAEELCMSYSRFFGVQVSIVRLFSVYGEGLRKQLLWEAVNRFASGNASFLGTGHEIRDWIHVKDAADLLVAAATPGQQLLEIYNGGHSQATTQEVLGLLSRACGGGITPNFSGETHNGNPRRLTANCAHSRRQLGWSPRITLPEGVSAYATWYRGHVAISV